MKTDEKGESMADKLKKVIGNKTYEKLVKLAKACDIIKNC